MIVVFFVDYFRNGIVFEVILYSFKLEDLFKSKIFIKLE